MCSFCMVWENSCLSSSSPLVKRPYSLDSTSIPVIISYTANATRGHTLLERGFLTALPTPPSPLCNFVLVFEIPIENNKHPNFEWRGGGGVWILLFSEVTLLESRCRLKMKGDFDWSCKDIWKISGLSPLLLLSQCVHFFFKSLFPNTKVQNSLSYVKLIAYLP